PTWRLADTSRTRSRWSQKNVHKLECSISGFGASASLSFETQLLIHQVVDIAEIIGIKITAALRLVARIFVILLLLRLFLLFRLLFVDADKVVVVVGVFLLEERFGRF